MSKNRKNTEDVELTEALEMYIKTIFELEEEFGSAAPSDIAMKLEVKAPSVTSALQKLDSIGMVEYQRYQHVNLTSKGKKIAKMLDHRHQTLLDFLLLIGVVRNRGRSRPALRKCGGARPLPTTGWSAARRRRRSDR